VVFEKGSNISISNSLSSVWKNIDIKYGDDWWRCWEWKGYKNKSGYGRITINYKNYTCHRIIYELVNNIIPDNLCICHTCNNPSCCNPNHLYLATHAINNKQCRDDKRNNIPRGENHYKTILTNEDILEIRIKYSTNSYTQREMGKEYGVSDKTIDGIVSHRRWKHI